MGVGSTWVMFAGPEEIWIGHVFDSITTIKKNKL